MSKKIILVITLLSIFLIGCTDKKVEADLTKDGQVELEAHNYSQAMKIFSTVLESDKENVNARAMYMQAMKMKSVEKYKSHNDYKKAIAELEAVEKIKNGSSAIKTEASNKLKEMKKMYESQLEAQKKRKEEAKSVASKDTYKASQQLKVEEERIKAEEEKKKQEELENIESQESVEPSQQAEEVKVEEPEILESE